MRAAEVREAVRVTASAFPALAGTWNQVRLVADTGSAPWRGVVTVTGRGGAVNIALALPAHGQRVLAVPFRIGSGESALAVAVDGVPRARIDVAPRAARPPRLVADGDRLEASRVAADARVVAVAIDRLPEAWRAYDAFDLVVLPRGGEARLRRSQEAALERWVRWGGAVGSPGGERATARALGDGFAIVAPSVAGVERERERLRPALADPGSAALARWDETRPSVSDAAAGTALLDPRLAMPIYLSALGVAAVAVARSAGARRSALPIAVLLILAGSLGTWSLARAGNPAVLEVDEVSLVRARPGGGETHVSAVVRARAHRRSTIRLVPRLEAAALGEAGTPRVDFDPRRAVRWDPDGAPGSDATGTPGVWERSWALGETATIRVDGLGPALDVRAASRPDGGWTVENRGRRRLTSISVVSADRLAQALGDLEPGGRLDVSGPPTARIEAPGFWRSLLPSSGPARTATALLARVDPPLGALEFPAGGVRLASTSYVVLSLPQPSGSGGR